MLPMTAFLTATVLLLAPAQDATPRTWDVDGVKREAIVYAPSKKTKDKVLFVSVLDLCRPVLAGRPLKNAGNVQPLFSTAC
jgi:hypothetical protein